VSAIDQEGAVSTAMLQCTFEPPIAPWMSGGFMRVTFPIEVAAGVLVCGIIATGCSQSPVAPSSSATLAAPTVTDSVSGSAANLNASEGSLTPEALEGRGWDCQPAPGNPIRLTCSHPNQLHPVLLPGPPPPADRPASITLLVFDNGVFVGTDVLIRSDLYNGQPCRSTGDVYRFLARIGYYECPHQSQAK
jgi:hypothetical protein